MRLAPLAAKAPVVEPRAVYYLSDLGLQLFVTLTEFGCEGPRELNGLREQRLQCEFLVGCQVERVQELK